MIPLDYATPGGPNATRDGDLIVVTARVSRLPPVCVVTGRTAEEAEAAGTRLVPLTMSYDRRLTTAVAVVVLSLGCAALLIPGAIIMGLVSPPFLVRGWVCRSAWWMRGLAGLGITLMFGVGTLVCSVTAVLIGGSAAPPSPAALAVATIVWLTGISLLLAAVALPGEPLRRRDVADGRLRLSGASAALLAALPADSPGNDTGADGTGRAAASEA